MGDDGDQKRQANQSQQHTEADISALLNALGSAVSQSSNAAPAAAMASMPVPPTPAQASLPSSMSAEQQLEALGLIQQLMNQQAAGDPLVYQAPITVAPAPMWPTAQPELPNVDRHVVRAPAPLAEPYQERNQSFNANQTNQSNLLLASLAAFGPYAQSAALPETSEHAQAASAGMPSDAQPWTTQSPLSMHPTLASVSSSSHNNNNHNSSSSKNESGASVQPILPAGGEDPNHVSMSLQAKKRRVYRHEPFPDKLYRMLEETAASGKSHIISFSESGKSFKIHQDEAFVKEIMPVYFRAKSLSSFKRLLNM